MLERLQNFKEQIELWVKKLEDFLAEEPVDEYKVQEIKKRIITFIKKTERIIQGLERKNSLYARQVNLLSNYFNEVKEKYDLEESQAE